MIVSVTLSIDAEYADSEAAALQADLERFLDEHFGDEIRLRSFVVGTEQDICQAHELPCDENGDCLVCRAAEET